VNLAGPIAEGRIVVIPKGAWNECASLTLSLDPEHPARNSFVEDLGGAAAGNVSAEVAPLDLMVQELALERVDFVKMDIEGAEIKALEGAATIIRRWRPQLAIAVEHTDDWLANAQAVRELVLGLNPAYRVEAGPYMVTRDRRLAPEILYFR
jgi:FkbM family methyltransferase